MKALVRKASISSPTRSWNRTFFWGVCFVNFTTLSMCIWENLLRGKATGYYLHPHNTPTPCDFKAIVENLISLLNQFSLIATSRSLDFSVHALKTADHTRSASNLHLDTSKQHIRWDFCGYLAGGRSFAYWNIAKNSLKLLCNISAGFVFLRCLVRHKTIAFLSLQKWFALSAACSHRSYTGIVDCRFF